MVISITRLKLKSFWKIFSFMGHTAKIVKQLNQTKVIDYKTNSSLLEHFTLSFWNNLEELREFSRAGAHASAVKTAGNITVEIQTYHYESDVRPDWKEAKKMVKEKGRLFNY